MKRLTKEHRAAYENHKETLEELRSNACDAVETYNYELECLDSPAPALEALNEAIGEFNSWVTEVQEQMRGYFDERTEGWQEGEKGEQYQAWIDSLDYEVDDVDTEPDAPTEMDEPEIEITEIAESPEEAE
jgi:hypothetical protein